MDSINLPKGWEEKQSSSHPGKYYYINKRTGKSQWEIPLQDDDEIYDNPIDEVQALHILKKHNKSRRPASWRNPNITQTKNEAIEQIKTIRKQLIDELNSNGVDNMITLFKRIASVESDCSSATKGGDLGTFSRGQMQKSFEDATFALQVNGLSDLVDSDSGIHIILRLK